MRADAAELDVSGVGLEVHVAEVVRKGGKNGYIARVRCDAQAVHLKSARKRNVARIRGDAKAFKFTFRQIHGDDVISKGKEMYMIVPFSCVAYADI